jgi:hypothetical protein
MITPLNAALKVSAFGKPPKTLAYPRPNHVPVATETSELGSRTYPSKWFSPPWTTLTAMRARMYGMFFFLAVWKILGKPE